MHDMQIIRVKSRDQSYVVGAKTRAEAIYKAAELLGLELEQISANGALLAIAEGAKLTLVKSDQTVESGNDQNTGAHAKTGVSYSADIGASINGIEP